MLARGDFVLHPEPKVLVLRGKLGRMSEDGLPTALRAFFLKGIGAALLAASH
jgi:hypothetical protein